MERGEYGMALGTKHVRSHNLSGEKWHRIMQKIQMHDEKHRIPESIGDFVAIVYENLPGPDQRQSELLVWVIQALAMMAEEEISSEEGKDGK